MDTIILNLYSISIFFCILAAMASKQTSSAIPAGSTADGEARSARGAQARDKLKKAALQVLERVGYHKMRVADVTEAAGVATGLFYHYFPDLKSLTIEVLTDFVAASQNLDAIEKDVAKGDWYGRILAHNQLAVKSYAEHPGVMRCLLQLADEDADFGALLRDHFHQQLNWLVQRMPKLFPQAGLSEHQALLAVYTLAGSGESILRDYYIHQDPALTRHPVKQAEMAELLAVMFYRGLFLQNPPAERLAYTSQLLDMSKPLKPVH
ncbi:MAG: TetR/AcrR family transcriptional regulator [Gammaproteobacteria bacterium]|nr:MAG: TetR/AcrR family transcriptional regulator [Gammaproteobacteria bacterium]